jgi:HK97 family phage prohead protease
MSTKQKTIEYKWFAGEMKATNDKEGIIEGLLNPIGNIDDGDDRTIATAFKRTLNAAYQRKSADSTIEYLWPYLWNHDYNLIPPGGIFDAEETPQGLFTKTQLNLDYQLGRDLYSAFKTGTLRKQSMGYICHKSEYVKEGPRLVRNLLEVEILEGSAVVFPMNQLAEVTGIKSGLWTPQRYWHGSNVPQEKVTKMDKDKNKTAPEKPAKKDFNDLYQDAQAADALEDWGDLLNSLTGAMIQLFTIGDQPAQDMSTALEQFGAAVLTWTEEAQQAGLSDMLSDSYGNGSSDTPYIPYNMRVGDAGYMSNRKPLAHKAGAAYSQANLDMLGMHLGALHSTADTIHQMADDLAENTGATSYVDPDAKPDPAKETDKNKANPRANALRKHSLPNDSTADVDDGQMDTAMAALTLLSNTLS